jgi:hypothetical protein
VYPAYSIFLFTNTLCPGCTVENSSPKLLQFTPDQIKPGLQNAAKEAYLQSKADPQLIVVILPVRGSSTTGVAYL